MKIAGKLSKSDFIIRENLEIDLSTYIKKFVEELPVFKPNYGINYRMNLFFQALS